jgi:UDP-N-acetylglucosamine 1-carboxyvinyltransferase
MSFIGSYIKIRKSDCLGGVVCVNGAKNSVLPIGAATVLSCGKSTIKNVPNYSDVHSMVRLVGAYGGKCFFNSYSKTLEVDCCNMSNSVVPELFGSYRASTILAGSIFARFKDVFIGVPGGDKIGKRAMDIHLKGFKAFGASIEQTDTYTRVFANKLHGAEIFLDYASVGATQNFLLVASSISEKTVLYNAAQEPECIDLINVLRKMGAKINCGFQSKIEIIGNENLIPFEHHVIEDRLEAATLLVAAAITGGTVRIPNIIADNLRSLISKLKAMGHQVEVGASGFGITFTATDNPEPVNIKTMPYPGFSTDLQSPMMALLSITPGVSFIHETVFENRMLHAHELNKMGANISIEGDFAKINGVGRLYGTPVNANDIRACAALILAGLVAEGETIVYGVDHLVRGYEDLDKKLALLGANIRMYSCQDKNFNKKCDSLSESFYCCD